MVKEVRISATEKVARGKESKMKEKPGGSNVGKYKDVKSFAGPSGGSPKGSFPIDTKKRAKAALAYAHNAPSPSGIRKAVHEKYPSLGAKTKEKK